MAESDMEPLEFLQSFPPLNDVNVDNYYEVSYSKDKNKHTVYEKNGLKRVRGFINI